MVFSYTYSEPFNLIGMNKTEQNGWRYFIPNVRNCKIDLTFEDLYSYCKRPRPFSKSHYSSLDNLAESTDTINVFLWSRDHSKLSKSVWMDVEAPI